MKTAALAFALFLPLSALPAELLTAPDNWRQETFDFPLAFAPAIGLEGKEFVRFSPGWSSFASERGFSYVFLWDVKEVAGPALTVNGLEFALRSYFDGLMTTAAEARKIEAGTTPTQVDLHPMKEVAGWSESHAGAVHTWNAFAKGEPLRLNIEVTKRPCPNARVQLFFALSKAQRSAAIWDELRAIRERAACAS
jgi:hypothetical protein